MSVLPETAAVHWRPRLDDGRLRRRERGWTLSTFSHTVPWLLAAATLIALEPLSFPVAAVLVVRPRDRSGTGPEAMALGLLGDLVGHEARDLHARTGLVLERGALGVWLVGEAGALLVRPGGRRADCWCVKVDADLPSADRTAHLLLALREDEAGFATVANLAFSGAVWRIRRRLPGRMRPAVDAARAAALARMSNAAA